MEPSIYAGDEVEAFEDELLVGMKVTVLMLNGAIKLADGLILTTPLPGAPTVGVFYRQYYLWGRSSDLKRDGSTRCGI